MLDRKTIGDKLIEIGIYPNLKGFEYIIDAIDLYKIMTAQKANAEIAKKHGVTPTSIERCIRHAKEGTEYKYYKTKEFIALYGYQLEQEESDDAKV